MLRVSYPGMLATLAAMPPCDLKGPALIRRGRFIQGEFFPVDLPEEALVEAALELIAYGEAARELSGKLGALGPCPLREEG